LQLSAVLLCADVDRSRLHAGPTAATPPRHAAAAVDRRDRQTDRHRTVTQTCRNLREQCVTDLADNDASKTNEKSESRVRKIERVINSADARAVDFRSRPAQCDLGFLAAVLHPADSAATHVISRHHVNSPQYTVGQKSKLMILSEYVNKTEKIAGT